MALNIPGAHGAGDLGALMVRLVADSTELIKGLDNAKLSMAGSSTAMLKQASVLAVGAVAAFTAIATAAIKMADDFHDSFELVQERLKGSVNDVQRVRDEFRAMAREMPVNVNEINRVALGLLKLGVSKDIVVGLTRTMLDFQKVTGIATDQASRQIIQFGQTLQVPQAELSRITSAVLVLGEGLTTTSAEVIEMANKIGAVGKQAGLSAHQILSLSGAFTSVGVDSGRGGMMINQMLLDMSKSVAEADEKLGVFALTAGMTGEAFQKAFRDDATGAVRSFLAGLKAIEKDGDTTTKVLARLNLDGGQMASMLIKAAGNQKLFNDALGMGKKAWEENNAVTLMAQKRYENLSEQVVILWNRLKDVAITLGEPMLAVLETVNSMLQALTKSTGDYAEVQSFAANATAALVTGLGMIADVFYGLRGLLLTFQIGMTAMLHGLGVVLRVIIKGVNDIVEGTVNSIVTAINFVIRQINNLEQFLPDWAQTNKGKPFLKEITWKLKVDASQADLLAKSTELTINDLMIKLGNLSLAGKPSERFLAEYEKIVAGVKEKNKELEKNKIPLPGGGDATTIKTKIAGQDDAVNFLKNLKPAGGGGGISGRFLDSNVGQAAEMAAQKKSAEAALKILESMNSKELELTDEQHKIKLQHIKEYNDKVKELQTAQTRIVLDSAQSMADSLASMAESFGGKQSAAYKAMFAVSKAFAIADATVKISQGIAGAFSLPWPANLAAAASVMAATSSIVSSIMAVKLTFAGNKERGGSILPGQFAMIGERGPELLATPGTVIPNDRIGGKTTINIINQHGGAQVEATESQNGNERVIEVMIREVKSQIAGEIRNGIGVVNSAMTQSFGLRRGSV